MMPPRGNEITTLSNDSPSFNSIDCPGSDQYMPEGLVAPNVIETYCDEY